MDSVSWSTSMSMATLPVKVNDSRSGRSVSVYLVGLTSFGSMTAFDSVIVFLSGRWCVTSQGRFRCSASSPPED